MKSAIQHAIHGLRMVAAVTIHPLFILFSEFMKRKPIFDSSFHLTVNRSYPISNFSEAHRLKVVEYDEFNSWVNSGESPLIDISATYMHVGER